MTIAFTLDPLRSYCEEHGYRWRWDTRPAGAQWRATVQIIDPTKEERRDRIRAWIAATAHDELSALRNAIAWSIDDAHKRHQIDAKFRIGDGKGKVAR